MMVDLLGGHVASGISLMDDMVKHHKEGKLRIIGVFADKRSPLLPEVPTFAEQGFSMPSGEAWSKPTVGGCAPMGRRHWPRR
jgi:tripartite-type tricarboxylate transporter receptor subunit TctC